MSNHIYFGNIKNKKKIKLISNITLGVFVVFSAIYLYMASTIGIYVYDDFFKKSPSLTEINYNAVSNSSPIQNIKLTNNIDESYTIEIDGNIINILDIETLPDGTIASIEVDTYEYLSADINDIQLAEIALQKNEVRRQPIYLYIVPLIILIAVTLFSKYSTEIHSKLFKDRVFTDKYFTFIDYLPIYLAYIIIALLTITL